MCTSTLFIPKYLSTERGRHVINGLSTGFEKGLAAEEIQLHGLRYFLRLLLVRDYRKSVKVYAQHELFM